MTPELKADPETSRQAEVIGKQMAARAWEELDRWFWTAKIEAIETAEVAAIDINGLPNADDGHLVPFIEVFPLARIFHTFGFGAPIFNRLSASSRPQSRLQVGAPDCWHFVQIMKYAG
jgi:hypothetical protein